MKNQIFNPGEYYDWEKEEVEFRLNIASGKVPPPPPPPFFLGQQAPIAEEEILEFNKLWNPYDPLYNDPQYAREHGHPSVPAYPGFKIMANGTIPGFPKNMGSAFYYTNDGVSATFYRNIYAGDVLKSGETKNDFRDGTKPGSDVRTWHMGGEATTFDQNGEPLFYAYGNTRDCYKKFTDGTRLTFTENMSEWTTYFPEAHVTTDEDWNTIRGIWAQEVVNGDNTPCWEDVEVGFELPKTCSDGPVTYMHMMAWHNMGSMSIFTREELSDPDKMDASFFKDRFGQYLDETSLHYAGRNIPGFRGVWYNHTGALIIARTVTNWIGNYGRVSKFCWRFFPFFKELRTGPIAADMFNKVPGMEGRDCDRHGAEGDTCIGRAVVTGKYINDKGEHCIEIACWGEDLEGNIVQACPMEAVLPSKNK